MNVATAIILIILIVIVSFSVRATIRDRKKGAVQDAPAAEEAAVDAMVKWNR